MAIYRTDPDEGIVSVAYAVVGTGTRALTTFEAGERLETVGPLGRPFELGSAQSALVIGRGVGSCSLTMLATKALVGGVAISAVDSSRNEGGGMAAAMLREFGIPVLEVSDELGTSDPAPLELELRRRHDSAPPDLIAVCGSSRLTAGAARLAARWKSEAQVSVEAHMACGMGYCHGCATGSRSTEVEEPLVCRDGPVFRLTRNPASAKPKADQMNWQVNS
jgi:dihydroorotate dehydrogenase electron transfer subunit